MKWVILFVGLASVAVWAHMSRYQYVPQNIMGIDYIVRIDKLTDTRCIFSGPPGIVGTLQISACEGYERLP